MPETTAYYQVQLTEAEWMLLTRTIYPASETSELAQETYNALGQAKIVWK